MAPGQLLRIEGTPWGRIGAGMVLAGLVGACDREPDFDPPARIQVICSAPSTSSSTSISTSPSAPPTGEPIVLVLDTGDRRARWANGPGAPMGVLTVEDHQYVVAFAGGGTKAWRATLNRFDGNMVLETGKRGAAGTRERLACKREAEGPRL